MSDYDKRIKEVKSYLKENNLGGFFVLTKLNRIYLSGFTGSKGILVIASGAKQSREIAAGLRPRDGAALFVDERYTIRAKKESGLPVLPLTRLSTTARGTLSRKGRGKKGRTIGIEDNISLRDFQDLKKKIKGVKFKVTKNVIEELRAVKQDKELRLIKKGSKIIDGAFAHLRKVLKKRLTPSASPPYQGGDKVGVTEIELAYELEKYGKKNGAEALAFEPIVAFGKNAAAPHHLSSGQKIGSSTGSGRSRNNFLLLDFGMKIAGYHTDFTRTLFLGRPNKKQEAVYNIVLRAQQRMIAQARAGVPAKLVDSAGRDYIAQMGYGDNYTHNGGHGVGLEIHEPPNFSPKSEDVLQENMVVTAEPGIYLEGEFGVRIEDMVRVTSRGPQVLSKIGKRFKEMIIN